STISPSTFSNASLSVEDRHSCLSSSRLFEGGSHLKRAAIVAALWLLALVPAYAQQKTILFDAKHAQTAGNADWTLDEDSCGIAQRYPTPDQAGITASTAETYWSGAFSAMGVDLVKKGFHVESLPTTARISYGDATNPQDLQ